MSNSNSKRARTARPSKTPPIKPGSAARRDASQGHPRQGRPATGASRVAAFRSRHPVAAALVPVGLVLAIVAAMVVIKLADGSSTPGPAGASPLPATASSASSASGAVPLSAGVLAALNVPPSVLDAVGQPSSVSAPNRVNSTSIGRGADGKPLITYVGAEYCPYCAAERWALAVALSRFGTFSGLSGTHSASNDVYPSTQTLSFYGSHYSSLYVDFQSVELATNQAAGGSYQTLQTPTAQESALLSSYDGNGSIPFLDVANRYVVTGASFSPQVLQGLTRAEIAAQLDNAHSAVAQAIDGTANEITAAIVSVTGDQPASVAASPVIASIAKALGA